MEQMTKESVQRVDVSEICRRSVRSCRLKKKKMREKHEEDALEIL